MTIPIDLAHRPYNSVRINVLHCYTEYRYLWSYLTLFSKYSYWRKMQILLRDVYYASHGLLTIGHIGA